MLRLFHFLLLGLFFFVVISVIFISQTYAAPVCNGTFTCNVVQNICRDQFNNNCNPSFPEPGQVCTCSQSCAPGTDGPWNCSGSTCPDPGGLCSELCGIASYGCIQQNDACIGDSECGSNSRCCAGSPNYCSPNCYDCAGNYICSSPTSTSAPTPTPSGLCSPGDYCGGTVCTGCGVGVDTYCGSDRTCSDQRTVSGNFCNSCTYCAPGTGACPTGSPSDPTPTSSTCSNPYPGTCGCCPSGTFCNNCGADSNGQNIYTCGSCGSMGLPSGPICSNSPSTSYVCVDQSNNNSCSGSVVGGVTVTMTSPTFGTRSSTSEFRTYTCSDYYDPITNTYTSNCGYTGVEGRYTYYNGSAPYTITSDSPQMKGIQVVRYPVTGTDSLGCPTYGSPISNFYPGTNVTFTPPSDAVVHVLLNPTYTISGTVYEDVNGNGARDCVTGSMFLGQCIVSFIPPVSGTLEPAYPNASLTRSGSSTQAVTNSAGYYTFSNLPAGSYTITLNVPSGYVATTTNPRTNINASGNPTNINFGIRSAPPPSCPGGILEDPGTTVAPGGSVELSLQGCTNLNPTPTISFDWDPPIDDNPDNSGDPRCDDGVDNDLDGLVDEYDPGCHFDGDADDDNDGIIDTLDPDSTDSYTPYDDNETTDSNTCPDAGITGETNTSTSSTVTYNAPSCPTTPLICTPNVTIRGPGGNTNYTTNLTIDRTYQITTNIRSVTDFSSCTPTSGDPYTDSLIATNITGGVLPPGGITQQTSTGSTIFACLPNGDYTVSLAVPPGYTLVGRTGGSPSGLNGITFTNLSSDTDANFCIAQTSPWYQTTQGDARFPSISNPIPLGKYASTDPVYPGIFYSSKNTAQFGFGEASTRNWVVNDEYSYNALTENRNGGLSYDFFKQKARQDGVTITEIDGGTLDDSQFPTSGVYEVGGTRTITSFGANPLNISGKRVVILVEGDVTIDQPVDVASGNGLFILASKGNIRIDENVGTTTLSSTSTQLEGYYTAHGSIILEGDRCSDGSTPDRRLNVGGALIANALKPFSSTGLGRIQNNRSLCLESVNYPSLYVVSRPDFLIQLTDFYKTSYTKWQEVNP